jgi:hypothetical protein
VFKWCEATLRPPSSQLFELFARVAGRCSDVQKATAEYQVWPILTPNHSTGVRVAWALGNGRLSIVQ